VPIIMTGPRSAADYFTTMCDFIRSTLGARALDRFRVIIDDVDAVATAASQGVGRVTQARAQAHETYFFNWRLNIGLDFQAPFVATHESMAALELGRHQPPVDLAVNLRRAFSGIVAGNVREEGSRLVAEHGPFEIRATPALAAALDHLLRGFVLQQRMKLSNPEGYKPCFRIAA
jgi:hypothetical protein